MHVPLSIRARLCFIALLILFNSLPPAAGIAWAQDAVARNKDPVEDQKAIGEETALLEIVVLDVRVTGDIDPRRLEGVSGLLVAEAGRNPGLDVRSSADMRALLGLEAERQMLGCDDDVSCLAEIAGALGVEYILASEVTRIGEIYVFNLTLLEARTGRARGRASHRVTHESQLLDAADRGLQEVLSALGIASPPAFGAEKAPPPRKRNRLGLGLGGTGAVFGVGGGVLLVSAWQTYWATVGDDPASVTMADIDSARKVRGPVGAGLMAGGAVMIAGAILIPKTANGNALANIEITDEATLVSFSLSFR